MQSPVPFHLLDSKEKQEFLLAVARKDFSIYHYIIFLLNVGAKISILIYFSFILYKNKNLFTIFSKNEEKWKVFILFIVILLYVDLFLGLFGFLLSKPHLVKLSALILPFIIFLFFILSQAYPEITRGIKQEIKKNRYERSKIESLDVSLIVQTMENKMKKEKLLLIEKPQNIILSITYSVGFNSKSAFNKAFKQFTGLTPLQFRKRYSNR